MHATPDEGTRRLTDLHHAQPGDTTTRNLLHLLVAKIELCERLAVYEYEATTERHPECAAAFRSLADAERTSYESLLSCLTSLLAEHQRATGAGELPVRPGACGSHVRATPPAR